MLDKERYPTLTNLMDSYLHQDGDIMGEDPTLPSVIQTFIGDSGVPAKAAAELRQDIEQFVAANEDADRALKACYPNSLRPEGWHLVAKSWLQTVVQYAEAAAGSDTQIQLAGV